MEPQPAAPPVVVVVVTTDPGDWFEECLASLAAQDYPNLSVLVVDTASATDPTARVAEVLPRAFVRRLPERVGFGTAANHVLDVVEGASHYLLCHDDVALAPDAVRLLVEEAFRSNAAVTTPKLVMWDDPDRLLAVGSGADRLGRSHPLVETGELDQEQHDAVRDVFVAPSAATLVRADLFATLDGFAPGVDQYGEDLDLCWRAQIAGARVVAVPSARVRHLQAQVSGLRAGPRTVASSRRARRSVDEHRLRTAYTCYRLFNLLWLLPALGLQAVAEAAVYLFKGSLPDAAGAMGAPWRAMQEPRQLWSQRRRVQRRRRLGDGEVGRMQTRGPGRLPALVRTVLADPLPASGSGAGAAPGGTGSGDRRPSAPEPAAAIIAHLRPGEGWRWALTVVAVLAALFLVGGRSLLAHAIPAIGHLPPATGGPARWWQQWWSPWRSNGLGSPSMAPPALAALALAGTVLGGSVGVLQHLVVLGPLVLGPVGVWRAARRFGSRRGVMAATIVYAVLPLAYDDLAAGRWAGLLAYAAMPWIVASLATAGGAGPLRGMAPYRGERLVAAARLALLVGLLGAFVPVALVVVPVVGVALAAGQALTGDAAAGGRSAVHALAASAGAMVLLLPWSAGAVTSAVTLFGVGGSTGGRLGLGAVVRFATGPVGRSPLDWAILVAAALPLLVGRSWRLAWAARWWTVAVACWGLAWAGAQGWLPVPGRDPGVILAPAAVAVALAAGLGAAAFDRDLPRYRLGWRQLASAAAAVSVVVGAVPMLAAAGGGRWDLPSADASSVLAFPAPTAGAYRVLWVGDPGALPLASWPLRPGVGYATSIDGEPDLSDQWPAAAGASRLLADDLELAATGRTTTLGHLLAPLAVRYLVIPNHDAPSGSGAAPASVPAPLLSRLTLQGDLRLIHPDPDYTVYANAAWSPAAAVVARARLRPYLGGGPAASLSRQRALLGLPLGGSSPVPTTADLTARPRLSPAGMLYLATAFSDRWTVRSGGAAARPVRAFGWAMAFPARSGPLSVTVHAPVSGLVLRGVELGLWAAAVVWVLVEGRRRRRRRLHAPVAPEVRVVDLVDRRPVPAGAAGLAPEELWADG
jgi:GT2 family glycosyltransferase